MKPLSSKPQNDNAPAQLADYPAFIRLEGRVDCGVVLVCDHASNRLPPEYGSLGLAPDEFERHIAYDLGAAGVTRRMSELLGAPALLSTFSRLLVDPNRAIDDPTLIMQLSDGAVIPGNAPLGEQERQRRVELFYEPYHQAIEQTIEAAIAAGVPPVIVSLHSFTQEWRGALRPWEAAVLWDRDARLVKPVLECLRMETDFTIGDNEPYSGRLAGDSMSRHGTSRGLAHVLVEIRQDQIRDEQGQSQWAGRLADILQRILADRSLAKELHTIRKVE